LDTILPGLIIGFILGCIVICITITIFHNPGVKESESQEVEQKYPTIIVNSLEEIELKECPLCKSKEVKLNPVNDSYLIKCNTCNLETNYYSDLGELVHYWNNRQ
jgi:hypothetical protein